jgi:hypothetical protein
LGKVAFSGKVTLAGAVRFAGAVLFSGAGSISFPKFKPVVLSVILMVYLPFDGAVGAQPIFKT